MTAFAAQPLIPIPLGLPALPVPADNPPTEEKIALGKKMFFDRRLSLNGTMSCAMCHIPTQGFTAHELRTPVGNAGATVRRNAPTLLNIGYHPLLFHDGRDSSLETQVWDPLLATNEMANPSVGHLLERLRSLPDYDGLFETAFAGQGPSADRVGQALASYQRSLVSGHSRFDRFRYRGEEQALGALEKQGYRIFIGKGRCASCHLIGERSALLSDFDFHNTGIGWLRSRPPAGVTVQLAPGTRAELTAGDIRRIGQPPPSDLGRFEVSRDPADRWAYKTPMLRNIALTAPYMHDGSLATLEQVIAFYDQGGPGAPGQSPLVGPLGLNDEEKAALAAFLRTLTGASISPLDGHSVSQFRLNN
ncbi:cytochrome-c peroxidase [Zobellella aerophila]|uniref:Cytochrome c peroxidase n=1 Tax=Zobellella aerophila TaxID=870480 RepID=A0ABP6W018_9GAMM